MARHPRVRINSLTFVGKEIKPAELNFSRTLSFVYGASNTGKSFAVKAIDFMFGASRELPGIVERRGYDRVHLNIQIGEDNHLVLERALAGGDFYMRLANGNIDTLAARHNKENNTNISNYLLNLLDIAGKEIARDKSGSKKPLSFRDIARFCITDETSIQAERSPVESGDIQLAQTERNAFKFLLTGDDDSALITQVKSKDFHMGRRAQLRFVEEMISDIESGIAEDYPDVDQLDDLNETVTNELRAIEADIVAARASIRAALEEKRRLSIQITTDQQRINDISISLDNFEQLQSVYASDIARLEAIEEAGFLFSLDANMACPVCGALPEAQVHDHGLGDIATARAAAEVEISKIRLHQNELGKTSADTQAELERTGLRLLENRNALAQVEADIKASSPNAEEQQRRFMEIIPRRDRIKRGLELVARREELKKQRAKLEKAKQVRPKTNYQPGLSTRTSQDFADEVSAILTAWGFPGQRRVFFDLQTYDLIIDGKHRKDNGKGVRAITHAAFKVGLLTYCRRNQLPHPGFVVLDSPLITYRDPIRSALGPLSTDEQQLRNSGVKEMLFQHLSSLTNIGQFIIFDNADPPANAAQSANIEAFTNDPEQGRQGLLDISQT